MNNDRLNEKVAEFLEEQKKLGAQSQRLCQALRHVCAPHQFYEVIGEFIQDLDPLKQSRIIDSLTRAGKSPEQTGHIRSLLVSYWSQELKVQALEAEKHRIRAEFKQSRENWVAALASICQHHGVILANEANGMKKNEAIQMVFPGGKDILALLPGTNTMHGSRREDIIVGSKIYGQGNPNERWAKTKGNWYYKSLPNDISLTAFWAEAVNAHGLLQEHLIRREALKNFLVPLMTEYGFTWGSPSCSVQVQANWNCPVDLSPILPASSWEWLELTRGDGTGWVPLTLSWVSTATGYNKLTLNTSPQPIVGDQVTTGRPGRASQGPKFQPVTLLKVSRATLNSDLVSKVQEALLHIVPLHIMATF